MMASISWEKKRKKIEESHPEAIDVNWDVSIKEDPDLFARIIADVVKSSSGGSRPGKRPSLESDHAFSVFSKMVGDDFSNQSFIPTFRALAGTRSVRAVANKCNLSASYVHRLLNGEQDPSYEAMEFIASGFKKHPSYFLEYRIKIINDAMSDYLMEAPETASSWFLRLIS